MKKALVCIVMALALYFVGWVLFVRSHLQISNNVWAAGTPNPHPPYFFVDSHSYWDTTCIFIYSPILHFSKVPIKEK
jgi:hypothetical protein